MAPPRQETTLLRDDWPRAALEHLDRLLLQTPSDFADGRVSLLVCQDCGDQGCGAITMELLQDQESVSWTRFGWQTSAGDELLPQLFEDQTFAFSRTDYESALESLKEHYQKLITDPPVGYRS